MHHVRMVDVIPLLRDARPGDAAELTSVLLRSRTHAMPWLVSPHDEPSTRRWMQHVLLEKQRVRVAHGASRVLGFAAVTDAWLEQLYVDPHYQGRGVGKLLLEDAKRLRSKGLRLHVFTRNERARRFYEVHGFKLVRQSDGHDNEEQEPDCTYAWTP